MPRCAHFDVCRQDVPAESGTDIQAVLIPLCILHSKDPDKDRTKSHKIKKKIKDLDNFSSFYAHSLSNARQAEIDLCDDFDLKNCHVIGGLKKDSNYVYTYNLKLSK